MASALSRRQFVARGGLGTLAVMLGTGAIQADRAEAAVVPHVGGDLYSLGVASGDPTADGVVLWTRLAPSPLAADGGGGMPASPVRVHWQVAHDARFRHVVRQGTVTATPELAHSVHPEVNGLASDRVYFYRFKALGQISPVGRTRTAPARGARPSQASFAVVGCQNYPAGYYTAYRYVANEDVDFVMHTGDYLYEGGIPDGTRGMTLPATLATETGSLARYRTQYGLYKSDNDLQAAHAAHPWMLYWDDHEVENNYADETPQDPADAASFPARRAAAYQAYYEHLPLRFRQIPQDGSLQMYRRLQWGDLMGLNLLDGRQYRSDQTTPDHFGDADRTMLGLEQEGWLQNKLSRSHTKWNVVGNQTVVSWIDTDPGPGVTTSDDNWNGYRAARDRLLHGIGDAGVRNVVVFTGDAHCAMAGSLRRQVEQFDSSPVVASEFLCTSISSAGDGAPIITKGSQWLVSNPDMLFFDGRRGYSTVDVRRHRLTTTYKALDYVSKPDAPLITVASLSVLDGIPGVQGDRITQPGPLT